MGDPLAERVMHLLHLGSGHYPGDDKERVPDPERFLVYRVSDTEHAIMDREDRRDPEITIPTSSLLNPKFCVEGWYHKHVGQLRGYSPQDISKMRARPPGPAMGTPLGQRVAQLLQENGPYEKDSESYPHQLRFECLRL
ncbi:hypothetical protein EDD22DRAFT_760383, partial [Suillus occidentalis]